MYSFADDRAGLLPCWHCRKDDPDCWLPEWDAPIHETCVRDFLSNIEDGHIRLMQGYEVRRLNSRETITIFDEDCLCEEEVTTKATKRCERCGAVAGDIKSDFVEGDVLGYVRIRALCSECSAQKESKKPPPEVVEEAMNLQRELILDIAQWADAPCDPKDMSFNEYNPKWIQRARDIAKALYPVVRVTR